MTLFSISFYHTKKCYVDMSFSSVSKANVLFALVGLNRFTHISICPFNNTHDGYLTIASTKSLPHHGLSLTETFFCRRLGIKGIFPIALSKYEMEMNRNEYELTFIVCKCPTEFSCWTIGICSVFNCTYNFCANNF